MRQTVLKLILKLRLLENEMYNIVNLSPSKIIPWKFKVVSHICNVQELYPVAVEQVQSFRLK